MKQVKCFLAVLMLSSVMLLGCGDSAEKVESDSDQCVVVQVPDGSTVEELFTFKQKTQMALSYLEDDSTTVYRIGDLEEGGSIVWGANDAFLYVPGGADDSDILHYKDRLQDTPISYENFKELE